jgi:hypothetical protein
LPCKQETMKYVSSQESQQSEIKIYPGLELLHTNLQVFFIPSGFDVFEFECRIKY